MLGDLVFRLSERESRHGLGLGHVETESSRPVGINVGEPSFAATVDRRSWWGRGGLLSPWNAGFVRARLLLQTER